MRASNSCKTHTFSNRNWTKLPSQISAHLSPSKPHNSPHLLTRPAPPSLQVPHKAHGHAVAGPVVGQSRCSADQSSHSHIPQGLVRAAGLTDWPPSNLCSGSRKGTVSAGGGTGSYPACQVCGRIAMASIAKVCLRGGQRGEFAGAGEGGGQLRAGWRMGGDKIELHEERVSLSVSQFSSSLLYG